MTIRHVNTPVSPCVVQLFCRRGWVGWWL